MSLRLLIAGLVVTLPFANLPAAEAADLYDPYERGYSGSPYDDPRYADIYRHPKPPYPPAEPPWAERYEEEHDSGERYGTYDPPAPHKWRRDYLEPVPAPNFDYRPKHAGLPPVCLPPHEIRRVLIRDGWSDLRKIEIEGDVAVATARRPNGTLYRIELDRCDGEIVRAERIETEREHAWSRRRFDPTY